MKRVGLAVIACFVLLLLAFPHAGLSQSTTPTVSTPTPATMPDEMSDLWDTIDALEARIDELETQVAELQGQLNGDGSETSDLGGPTHTLTLELEIVGYDNILTVSSTNCAGDGGYDDLRIGTSITVRDGDGAVIANGMFTTAKKTGTTCTLTATIDDVPEVSFYQFDVSHRGAPSYSLEEMEASNWVVSLSIGT